MEARILEAMRERKKEFDNKALEALWLQFLTHSQPDRHPAPT